MGKEIRKKTLLIAGVLLVLFCLHAFFFNFLCDDAFITFRYARNWAEGYGPVYNLGERVEGYTNFLWMALLAGMLRIEIDPVQAARVLGFVFGLFTVLFTFVLSRTINPDDRDRFGMLAPAFLVFNGSLACWSLGGMETALFSFLVVLAINAEIRVQKNGSGNILSALYFSLAAMTRPEGIYLFCLTALFRLFMNFKNKKIVQVEDVVWGVSFLVIFLPFFLWRFFYYGYPFPNTFYAKTGNFLTQLREGIPYLFRFIAAFIAPWLLVLPGIVIDGLWKKDWIQYCIFLLLAYGAYIMAVGGDGLGMFRFFVPLLPLFYVVMQEITRKIVCRLKAIQGRVVWVALLFVALYTMGPSLYGLEARIVRRHKSINLTRWIKVGRFLAHGVPRDASIGLCPAGAVPYLSRLRTLDMLGLNDTEIAHSQKFLTNVADLGHRKFSAEIVLARRPTYLLLGNVSVTPYPMAEIIHDIMASKNHFSELAKIAKYTQTHQFYLEKEIYGHPDFSELYTFVSLPMGDGSFLNCYMLKDTDAE